MIPTTEQEHNTRIGKAIRYFRDNYKNPDKPKTLGITQTALAKRIFVTFQQVQKYEKGTNGTSSYRILQIAEALNISVRTTIVVFKGEKEVARIIGQTGKTEIYSAIKKGI